MSPLFDFLRYTSYWQVVDFEDFRNRAEFPENGALFFLYKGPPTKAAAGGMDQKGQLMGVPIKLIMAIVIGVMATGILMQFVGTAERMVLRDMDVRFSTPGNRLTVRIYDAASRDPLGGATVVVKYPGGMKAHTLGTYSNKYTFTIPLEGADVVVATVRVTRNGYIPWEGEVAVG